MANVDSITLNSKELRVDRDFIEKYKEQLNKYPNINTLYISDGLTLEQIDYLASNTNIKNIYMDYFPKLIIYNKLPDGMLYYSCNTTPIIIDKNITVTSTNLYRGEDIPLTIYDKSGKINDLNKASDYIKKYNTIDYISFDFGNHDNSVIYNHSIFDDADKIIVPKMDNPTKAIKYINTISKLVNNIDIVKIRIDNKDYDNLEEFRSIANNYRLDIYYGRTSVATLDEFLAMRDTLNYYKELILQNDLSSLERVIYAYDLIKSYKYQESTNKNDSRNIHSIVRDGKIVCVGYAEFLNELLKEVGIESYTISTSVPTDNGSVDHRRSIIAINDDKYNINGLYAFDTTWDSNKNRYMVKDKDGNELATNNPKEEETILREFETLSSYTYFGITPQDYSYYFPKERIPDIHNSNISFKNSDFYDNDYDFDYSEPINDEVLVEAIYNVRLAEGYSNEAAKKSIEDMELLNDIRRRIIKETNNNLRNEIEENKKR